MRAMRLWPVLKIAALGAAMMLTGAAAVWAAPPKDCGGAAGSCDCGDTVINNHTLTTDPVVNPAGEACPGDGLIVASSLAHTVHLNLGGHTLMGTARGGCGLRLRGAAGSVSSGRIKNFDVGVCSDGAIVGWNIVPVGAGGLTVTGNGTGISIDASGTDITDTAVSVNDGDGAVVRGDWNSVARISCSRNGGRALVVEGDGNSVQHNICDKNGSDGILVQGDDNTLVRNLGTTNGGTGVRAVGDRNDFQNNIARRNVVDGVVGEGGDLSTNGHNYGTGNGGTNCHIDGFPSAGGGRYC